VVIRASRASTRRGAPGIHGSIRNDSRDVNWNGGFASLSCPRGGSANRRLQQSTEGAAL